MKITLIHNPSAGGGETSDADAMVSMIRKAGHEVAYQSSKEKDWQRALKEPADLIVVAGGDGTLGKVARSLAGTTTPLTALPCGTANNLAYELGLTDIPMRQLVDAWPSARRQSFDVGIVRSAEGEKSFVESLGYGLFAWTMARFDNLNPRTTPADLEHELRGAREFLGEQAREYKPRSMSIRMDEQEISGDFLLVEVMNIKLIGPNLQLAPQADPGDGLLDLVLVGAEHRDQLCDFLTNKDHPASFSPFTVHRCRRLQIRCDHTEYHVDDRSLSSPEKKETPPLEVSVQSNAVVFLVPDFG
jgi:diacylglycerol kinase family enzyme